MTFRDGYLVVDARSLRNEADYYLGRTYHWTTGTRTRVIGVGQDALGPGAVRLSGRPGVVTFSQFTEWVRVGTLTEC